MKFVFVAILLATFPALSQAATFEGHCSVLRQPSAAAPAKLLAYKKIKLNPGETLTIYEDGNVKYIVNLTDVSSPVIHDLQTEITYGAPYFLGSAQTSFNDKTLASGGTIGVGISLPGFPTFGCGSN